MDVALVVKKARDDTGLSVRKFADKAGVSPSTLSRIENRKLEPTMPMLEKLLEVASQHIVLADTDSDSSASTVPTLHFIRDHRQPISDLAAKYGVTDLRVFGSVARGDASSESDIDLLVRALPGVGLFSVEEFRYQVERLLGHSVDVMTDGALDDEIAHIARDAVAI